jgi:hypothetical protein
VPLAFLLEFPTGPDKWIWVIFTCLWGYPVLLFVAGILLLERKKAGLYLSWVLMPLILLSIPIGTLIGIFIINKITKPEIKALLT